MKKLILPMLMTFVGTALGGELEFNNPEFFGVQVQQLAINMPLSDFLRIRKLKVFGELSTEKISGSKFFDHAIYLFDNDSLRQIVFFKSNSCNAIGGQIQEYLGNVRTIFGPEKAFEVTQLIENMKNQYAPCLVWVLGENILLKVSFSSADSRKTNKLCVLQSQIVGINTANDYMPFVEPNSELKMKLQKEIEFK